MNTVWINFEHRVLPVSNGVVLVKVIEITFSRTCVRIMSLPRKKTISCYIDLLKEIHNNINNLI